jgi:hypothetical protein
MAFNANKNYHFGHGRSSIPVREKSPRHSSVILSVFGGFLDFLSDTLPTTRVTSAML